VVIQLRKEPTNYKAPAVESNQRPLGNFLEQYITVKGTFVRYGVKQGATCRWNTAIIKEVVEVATGKEVADHLWFVVQRGWLFTPLKEGSVVQVTGLVQKYERRNGTEDYGLFETSDLQVLSEGFGDDVPAKVWRWQDYLYFKFLTENGPRWYRTLDGITIERRSFIHVQGNDFDERALELTREDSKYFSTISEYFYQRRYAEKKRPRR
jgi:hypothetical protein